MLNRREFARGGVALGFFLTLPKFLQAYDCIQAAPKFNSIAGKKNRCAGYTIRASTHRFAKYFNWANAWNFAERNKSLKRISEEYWDERDYNEWWIDYFAQKEILEPGMILGAYYSESKWNGKFYTPNGKVWEMSEGRWRRYQSSGLQEEVLSEKLIGSLKKIDYTHLLCYAGKDCNGQHICWHQFPYENVIKQESILVSDFRKYKLFIKEIIDVSRNSNR